MVVPGRRTSGEQEHDASAHITSEETEVSMETQAVQEPKRVVSVAGCAHERLIDEILTQDGKRTGKVRCRECGTTFDDPYLNQT